jgi:hypothetical protein
MQTYRSQRLSLTLVVLLLAIAASLGTILIYSIRH